MTAQITPVSYTYGAAAAVTGVSVDIIRRAVRTGELVAHFPTARPVILADDLRAWINQAPTARVAS